MQSVVEALRVRGTVQRCEGGVQWTTCASVWWDLWDRPVKLSDGKVRVGVRNSEGEGGIVQRYKRSGSTIMGTREHFVTRRAVLGLGDSRRSQSTAEWRRHVWERLRGAKPTCAFRYQIAERPPQLPCRHQHLALHPTLASSRSLFGAASLP